MVGSTRNHNLLGMLLVSTLLTSLIPAYAQQQIPLGGYAGSGYIPGALSPTGPLPSFVNVTKGCAYEEFENTRMFVPVTVGVQYPPTSNVVLNRTSVNQGSLITVTETASPTMNTMNIYSNDTDTFTYHVAMHWEDVVTTPRIVTVEFLSQGTLVKLDRIPVINDFCKDIRITSAVAPHQKTVEELVGAAGVEAIDNMQKIVPAVNQNTDVIYTGQIIQIGEGAVIVLVVLAMVFQRFYGAKARRDQNNQLAETITKVAQFAKSESVMLRNNTLMRLEQEQWFRDVQKKVETSLVTLMHTIGYDASIVIKNFNDALAEFSSENGILFKKHDSMASEKVLSDVKELTDKIEASMEQPVVPVEIKDDSVLGKIKNIIPKKEEVENPAENSVEHFVRIHKNKKIDELYKKYDDLYKEYLTDLKNIVLKNELEAITKLIMEQTK